MTTLSKIIITVLISLLFVSCQFDINLGEGKRGNGNVVTEKRAADEDFTVVKATEGLDVYVTQDNKTSITVEADENVIELIRTDIRNGVLHIHTEERIGRAKSKKVHVSLPDIAALRSTSGADLYGTDVIKADKIELSSNSGADLKVEVEATEVECDTSSGADIVVSGTADLLIADASSGSDIRAGKLVVSKCIADASSGADIKVNATDELTANASSGGDVRYSGDPVVKKRRSSAGGVYKQ
ncbi:DUF2807 domain-containing protein [Leptobacterium flavescens]|uniref:DUF2807 domain-containing protein n=1 Tax=Leptobacterium flavescens TaxID=472055 RepID=A0A6P0UQL0_9FLAO|nr:head GIN domain-containing protein [Leptobacterium flavescens]NER14109.1 DUF2807 domain-containing protein [Leptobacterium flavescens]